MLIDEFEKEYRPKYERVKKAFCMFLKRNNVYISYRDYCKTLNCEAGDKTNMYPFMLDKNYDNAIKAIDKRWVLDDTQVFEEFYRQMRHTIASSFRWSLTKEGVVFWHNMSKKWTDVVSNMADDNFQLTPRILKLIKNNNI